MKNKIYPFYYPFYIKKRLVEHFLLPSDELINNNTYYLEEFNVIKGVYNLDLIQIRKKAFDALDVIKKIYEDLFFINTFYVKDINEDKYYLLSSLDDTLLICSLIIEDKGFDIRIKDFDKTIKDIIKYQDLKDGFSINLISNDKLIKEYSLEVENLLDNNYLLSDRIITTLDIGKLNVKNNNVSINYKEKENVNFNDLVSKLLSIKNEYQEELRYKHLINMNNIFKKIKSIEDVDINKKISICNDPNCLNKIRELTNTNIVVKPLNQVGKEKSCLICSHTSEMIIITLKNI